MQSDLLLFPEHLATNAKKQRHVGQLANTVRATQPIKRARDISPRRGKRCDFYAVAEGVQGIGCGPFGANTADSKMQTLLERYNPLVDLTAEERIEATARRVGLNMPVIRDE